MERPVDKRHGPAIKSAGTLFEWAGVDTTVLLNPEALNVSTRAIPSDGVRFNKDWNELYYHKVSYKSKSKKKSD